MANRLHIAYFCGEAVDSTLVDVAAEPRVFTSHDLAGPPIPLSGAGSYSFTFFDGIAVLPPTTSCRPFKAVSGSC